MRVPASGGIGLVALLLVVSLSLPAAATTTTPGSAVSSGCPLSGFTLPSGGSYNGSGGALAAQSLDPAAVPSRGFTMNVTMFDLPAIPATTAVFALGSEEVIGSDVLLMGLLAVSNLTGPYPLPFWGLLDNATRAVVNCGLDSYSASPGTPMDFAAEQTSGDNWTVLLNGAPFAGSSQLDLGAAQANWTGGISVVSLAGYTGTPWLPERVWLPAALTVRTGSQPHHLPSPVRAFWEGHNSTDWGEAGQAQNASLALGALEVGRALPPVTNGTLLWQAAATEPVSVSLGVSPRSISAGGRVNVSARATQSGAPLAGVNLSFTSSGGGSFTAGSATTGAGYSNVTFLTPPESRNTTLTLNATMVTPPYTGEASATLLVLSAPPLRLSSQVQVLPATTGAPGALLTLVVTFFEESATRAYPVPGLTLTVSASRNGGAFSPSSPWSSNATGEAEGTYVLPVSPGPVSVTFTIVSPGYEGSGTVNLTAANPSSSSGAGFSTGDWGGLALLAAAVVALALVAVYWRRRRASLRPHASPDTGSCPACGKALPEPRPLFCPSCGVPLGGSRPPPGPQGPD